MSNVLNSNFKSYSINFSCLSKILFFSLPPTPPNCSKSLKRWLNVFKTFFFLFAFLLAGFALKRTILSASRRSFASEILNLIFSSFFVRQMTSSPKVFDRSRLSSGKWWEMIDSSEIRALLQTRVAAYQRQSSTFVFINFARDSLSVVNRECLVTFNESLRPPPYIHIHVATWCLLRVASSSTHEMPLHDSRRLLMCVVSSPGFGFSFYGHVSGIKFLFATSRFPFQLFANLFIMAISRNSPHLSLLLNCACFSACNFPLLSMCIQFRVISRFIILQFPIKSEIHTLDLISFSFFYFLHWKL